jgi:Flp pilus assembly pilin Flp
MNAFLARFIGEESGQDLVEYGLLIAIFAIAAALVFPSIKTKMTNNYTNWGTNVRNLWIPKNP